MVAVVRISVKAVLFAENPKRYENTNNPNAGNTVED
jgi:hypothetical protein